jgi:hypothetical protein
MTAKLKAVRAEAPAVVTADSITAALARFKEAQAAPHEHYDPDLDGVFRFRLLTGQEVRNIGKLATVRPNTPQARLDPEKMEFLVVNWASVEPKVDAALWAQLLELWPMVAGRLSQAIRLANGLEEEDAAIEEAGKPSTASPS